MAFIEKQMSLDELIDSINAMPAHDDIRFFEQNADLIFRELNVEFRVMRDEAEDNDVDGEGWHELDD